MLRASILIVATLLAASASPAAAIEQLMVDRVKVEIAAYARAGGETSEEFAARIGSPLWHVESFVYEIEENGGTAERALQSLEKFAEALKDPERRQLLRCLGIRVPGNSDPSPSSVECAMLKHKFGAP